MHSYYTACRRCEQIVGFHDHKPGEPLICEECRKAEREPQGETLRLFQPAPNQIPGQLGLS